MKSLSLLLKGLRTQELRYKGDILHLLELLPCPLMVCDKTGKVAFTNSSASRIFGGLNPKHLSQLFPDLNYSLLFEQSEQQEAALNSPSLSPRWFRITPKPLFDAPFYILFFEEITELKNLTIQKKDLIANVSHELKTPITTISGYSEMLSEGRISSLAEAQSFGTIILRNAQRLRAIVEDLLKLSWIEGMEPEKIDVRLTSIHTLLKEVLEDLRAIQEQRNVKIEIRCSRNLKGYLHPTMMHHAILNLVDNAIKYSHPGGTVRIQAKQMDKELIFRVSDRGIGIPKEHIPRLFERFYRVDPSRSRAQGGTGLGLAIVKHAVLAHQGRIEVKSSVGKGTTMIVHIPSRLSSRKKKPRTVSIGSLRGSVQRKEIRR